MIGYDFDGTICEQKYVNFETMSIMDIIQIRMSCKLLIKPEEDAVIITARPIEDKEHTEQWLRVHNIKCPIYYVGSYPMNLDSICQAKLCKIKELGITTYYEDSSYICDFLKRNGINVIRV